MSVGQIVLGVVGAVIGAVYGGPYGAVMGFSIGMTIGGVIDPLEPDIPGPGDQDLGMDFTTAEEGAPIKDGLGTFKVLGNIIQEWGNRNVAIEESASKGGGGGSYVTEYEYYHSWVTMLLYGPDPADKLYTITFDEEVVFTGAIEIPAEGGVQAVTLGGILREEPRTVDDAKSKKFVCQAASSQGSDSSADVDQITIVVSGDCESELVGRDDAVLSNRTIGWKTVIGAGGGHDTDEPGSYGGRVFYNKALVTSVSYDSTANETTFICNPPAPYDFWPLIGDMVDVRYVYYYITTEIETTRIRGTMYFYYGTDDQVIHDNVGTVLEHPNLSPNYRRAVCAYFNDVYIGPYNRVPNVKFVIRKTPELAFNVNHIIDEYDYNPAHALYYIMTKMVGIDESMLDVSAFSDAADALHAEGRGISMLFDQQVTALTYIESILNHIGGLIIYQSEEDSSDV